MTSSTSTDFISITNEPGAEVDGEEIILANNFRYFSHRIDRQNGVTPSDDEDEDEHQKTNDQLYNEMCVLNNKTIRSLKQKIDCNKSFMDITVGEIFRQMNEITLENNLLKARILTLEREVL